MNYQKKIIDFSEGLLSKEEEQSLLSEIAVNDELRNQFKSSLAFEKNIRNAVGSIKPDKKMRAGIFAAAGFTDISSSAAAATASASSAVQSNYFISKYFPIIATAVLSSLLTGFTFFTYFNNSDDSQEMNNSQNNISEAIQEIPEPEFEMYYSEEVEIPKEIQQVRSIAQKSNIATIQNQSNNEKDIVKTSISNIDKVKDNKQIKNEQQDAKHLITYNINQTDKINNLVLQNRAVSPINEYEDITYENMEIKSTSAQIYDFLDNFSVEFSGIDNMFFVGQNVFTANVKPFINKNIGLNYHFNDHFFAGFSFRSENFYLTYNNIDEQNNRYIYEQQPILYSYNFYAGMETRLFSYFNPYVKLTAATTNIGPVARAESGLGLFITEHIQIFGGIGYDAIFYTHQNRNFHSNKWNINYGIKYKF